MSVLDFAFAAAQARPARVVFPEWDATEEARTHLLRERICEPVPVSGIDAAQIAAVMAVRGVDEGRAVRMLSRPMIRAAAMVSAGQADAMVAGLETPTRRVIEAALLGIGTAPGVSDPSSFFLMVLPDGREMVFADCAVNVSPDATALSGIAVASAQSAKSLLGEARVAHLSYSTGTSGTGPSVALVAEAARLSGFAGPVQADAALNAAIGTRKGYAGGEANTLIFPDLSSGNIAYKLVQELAGAKAIGPFLQGFARPVCDLSRGASAQDIVAATAITLMLSD